MVFRRPITPGALDLLRAVAAEPAGLLNVHLSDPDPDRRLREELRRRHFVKATPSTLGRWRWWATLHGRRYLEDNP